MTVANSLKCSAIAAVAMLAADVNRSHAVSPNFVLSAVRFEGNGVGSLDQFDAAGNLLRQIPISGFPNSVTMDRFGNTYVTLNPASVGGGWQVNKYGPAGELLGTIVPVTSSALGGLGIDSLDRLYVGDNGLTDVIRRFQLDGTPLGVFATVSTPAPGAPFALEFDSADRLYVPDNHLIERFDANGDSLGVFASVPNVGNAFVIDLGFDSMDTLYARTLNQKIYKFNAAGSQVGVLNLPGDAAGGFDIDMGDTLYVVGRANGASITKYTAAGVPIGVFTSGRPGEYYDVAIFNPIPEPSSFVLVLIGLLARRLAGRPADRRSA